MVRHGLRSVSMRSHGETLQSACRDQSSMAHHTTRPLLHGRTAEAVVRNRTLAVGPRQEGHRCRCGEAARGMVPAGVTGSVMRGRTTSWRACERWCKSAIAWRRLRVGCNACDATGTAAALHDQQSARAFVRHRTPMRCLPGTHLFFARHAMSVEQPRNPHNNLRFRRNDFRHIKVLSQNTCCAINGCTISPRNSSLSSSSSCSSSWRRASSYAARRLWPLACCV